MPGFGIVCVNTRAGVRRPGLFLLEGGDVIKSLTDVSGTLVTYPAHGSVFLFDVLERESSRSPFQIFTHEATDRLPAIAPGLILQVRQPVEVLHANAVKPERKVFHE